MSCSDDRSKRTNPSPPVGLGDARPLDRLRPMRPLRQPSGEIREVLLEVFPMVLPRLAVDPRRRLPLQGVAGPTQGLDLVDMMQERREPYDSCIRNTPPV